MENYSLEKVENHCCTERLRFLSPLDSSVFTLLKSAIRSKIFGTLGLLIQLNNCVILLFVKVNVFGGLLSKTRKS
jgi:hypothetical protein